MFDIKELKEKIRNSDGISVSEALEQRILNDQLNDRDYEFLSRAFGIKRNLENGRDIKKG